MSQPDTLDPFRDLRVPVVAAPMFLVSGPGLVIAQCRAGIVGTLPALNARTTEEFADWCDRLVNVDAPGATSANVRGLGHVVCERPIFPLDDDVTPSFS